MRSKAKTSSSRFNRKTTGFAFGRDQFAKISAVEGIRLTDEMFREFASFDQNNLSAEERRQAIFSRYGKAPV